MDFWNELWLNEGFATWVGWLAVDHLHPEWNVWGQFVVRKMSRGIVQRTLLTRTRLKLYKQHSNSIHFELRTLLKCRSVTHSKLTRYSITFPTLRAAQSFGC
jgi:hypothetical protein